LSSFCLFELANVEADIPVTEEFPAEPILSGSLS
jgi:hypothetical protein